MCRLQNIALESVTEKCDRQTDEGQSDPYVSLCFAGDTKKLCSYIDNESSKIILVFLKDQWSEDHAWSVNYVRIPNIAGGTTAWFK